jgi:exopolyphosphatase / guanosine-5'-triphosphate,3'-diphosphate pyrophosphatase
MFDVDVQDTHDELERRPPWQRIQDRKVAALDLGSNSFHLAIAELGPQERFTIVERVKERVQLGESVFESGRITAAAFERGLSVLRCMRDVLHRNAPEAVLAVATSAIREAENGKAFAREAARAAGVPIRIIDGLEEARLVCAGTRHCLSLGSRRMALFDTGGGSTEVVVADDRGCQLTASLALGTLRLRGELPCADRPTPAELRALEAHVGSALEPTLAHVSSLGFDVVVLTSGAARALQRLVASESALPDAFSLFGPLAARLELAALEDLGGRLAQLGERGRRALAGGEPDRADTLLTGAVILRVIMRRIGADVAVVSRGGLREGLIADYVQRRSAGTLVRVVNL